VSKSEIVGKVKVFDSQRKTTFLLYRRCPRRTPARWSSMYSGTLLFQYINRLIKDYFFHNNFNIFLCLSSIYQIAFFEVSRGVWRDNWCRPRRICYVAFLRLCNFEWYKRKFRPNSKFYLNISANLSHAYGLQQSSTYKLYGSNLKIPYS
jgi:hypothetical protein